MQKQIKEAEDGPFKKVDTDKWLYRQFQKDVVNRTIFNYVSDADDSTTLTLLH